MLKTRVFVSIIVCRNACPIGRICFFSHREVPSTSMFVPPWIAQRWGVGCGVRGVTGSPRTPLLEVYLVCCISVHVGIIYMSATRYVIKGPMAVRHKWNLFPRGSLINTIDSIHMKLRPQKTGPPSFVLFAPVTSPGG